MIVRTPFSIRVAWVTFILVAMTQATWAQAPQSLEDLMKRMLSAAQANALDEFVAQADPSAKIAYAVRPRPSAPNGRSAWSSPKSSALGSPAS